MEVLTPSKEIAQSVQKTQISDESENCVSVDISYKYSQN